MTGDQPSQDGSALKRRSPVLWVIVGVCVLIGLLNSAIFLELVPAARTGSTVDVLKATSKGVDVLIFALLGLLAWRLRTLGAILQLNALVLALWVMGAGLMALAEHPVPKLFGQALLVAGLVLPLAFPKRFTKD